MIKIIVREGKYKKHTNMKSKKNILKTVKHYFSKFMLTNFKCIIKYILKMNLEIYNRNTIKSETDYYS